MSKWLTANESNENKYVKAGSCENQSAQLSKMAIIKIWRNVCGGNEYWRKLNGGNNQSKWLMAANGAESWRENGVIWRKLQYVAAISQ